MYFDHLRMHAQVRAANAASWLADLRVHIYLIREGLARRRNLFLICLIDGLLHTILVNDTDSLPHRQELLVL